MESDVNTLSGPCYILCAYFAGLSTFTIIVFKKIVDHILLFHYGNFHPRIRENLDNLNDVNAQEIGNNQIHQEENLPTEPVYRFFSKVFVIVKSF